MKPSQVRELIKIKPIVRSSTARRLANCHTIDDLRSAAKKSIPRPVFDYVDGGADGEETIAANRQAFAKHRFLPSVLRDVAILDTSVMLFGRQSPLPLVLGPTGYTRMMHPDGEVAVARAALARGLTYTLSTVATTSIEDIASTGHQHLWFQLYLRRDRALAMELVRRARDANYRVLEITVDTTVAGRRIRDVRNGLTIPPQLSPRSILDIATKPRYWTRMLRSAPISFANAPIGQAATVQDIAAQFDPSISWEHLDLVRQIWSGPLVLKGLFGPKDALRAIESGVDALHLSNHGGRQLDRAASPLDVLPEIRRAVGPDYPLFLDSGIRHGSDIVTALAFGADTVMIGRAYLYGLMVAGQAGVEHAIALLEGQVRRSMQLLGVTSVAQIRAAGEDLFLKT